MSAKKRRRTLYSSKQDKKLVKPKAKKPRDRVPRCGCGPIQPVGLEFEYSKDGDLY